MLLLELIVEFFGDLFGIPGKVFGDPLLDIDNRDFLLLVERKEDVAQPLEQNFGILMRVPDNFAHLPWLILLFDSQLPNLLGLCRIGINNQMLKIDFCNPTFNLFPDVADRDLCRGLHLTLQDNKSTFLCNTL